MTLKIQLELPTLPYKPEEIKDFLNQDIFDYHYSKHHQAYVNKGKSLIAGTEYENQDLESIMKSTSQDVSKKAIFNNIAQVWNHTFYWHSITPKKRPLAEQILDLDDRLLAKLQKSFVARTEFNKCFKEAGMGQFGSGWVWLVYKPKSDKITIEKTANAENPIVNGDVPLLTMDVWEHAYYPKYYNKRDSYIDKFLEHINWDFVAQNLNEAVK